MESGTINRTESWFRPLKDGRLEVYLVGLTQMQGVVLKMRASGNEADIWRVVEQFEELTGLQVTGEWRRPPQSGARPLAGQLTIMEQLESGNGENELP